METFHVSLSCFIGDIFGFKHHKIKIRHLKKERKEHLHNFIVFFFFLNFFFC